MLMIKDGESHAIIHEIDIVYMWVGVSGTLTECDAHDRSHGLEDQWFITSFNCVTGPFDWRQHSCLMCWC